MVTTQSTQPSLTDLLPGEGTEKPLLRLRLRALTPLYLGGVSTKLDDTGYVEPDEQSTSVRGVIHWWLRALLGGVVEPDGRRLTVDRLSALEGAVLGTTDWTTGARISMRLEPGAGATSLRSARAGAEADEFSYVGWPLREMGENRGRNAWPVGTFVVVTLDRTNIDDGSPEALALAAAVWCWATLGALGTRGRRGFGALHVERVCGSLANAFAGSEAERDAVWLPPATQDGWQAFLEAGIARSLARVRDLARQQDGQADPNGPALDANGRPGALPAWPGFADQRWRLLVVNGGQTYQATLGVLSRLLRGFRCDDENPENATPRPSKDYPAVAGARDGTGTPPFELKHVEYGLPWPWRVRGDERPKSFQVVPSPSPQDRTLKKVGRRASPLMARPVVLDQRTGAMGLLLLLFESTFLPGAVPIRMRGGVRGAVQRPSDDYPAINAFLTWVPTERTEVAALGGRR